MDEDLEEKINSLPGDVPDGLLIAVKTVAIFTSITGLLGNITTCTVILCSKSMHTITDMYLLSLSIADISILGIHGFKMVYDIDICFSIWCLILHWISTTAMNVSALTITAFTCERYLAICHPFVAQTISTKSRVKKIIIVIWMTAALATYISLVKLNWLMNGDTYVSDHETMKLYFDAIIAGLCYILPILLITVMYTLIWIKLSKRLNKLKHATQIDCSASKKTLKMSIIIVAAFFVCWGPYHMTNIWLLFAMHESDINVFLSTIQVLYVTDTITIGIYPALNPFIYSIASKKFREAFKEIISNAGGKWFSSTSNPVNNNTTNIPLEIIS